VFLRDLPAILLLRATVYPHLYDLPHRGNMLVEKRYNIHFCAVGAIHLRHACHLILHLRRKNTISIFFLPTFSS